MLYLCLDIVGIMLDCMEQIVVDIINILFGGFCVGLASSVTVGPVAVLCIQRTLSKGHLSGLLSGLGIACADTLMAILAFTVYALLKSYIDQYNDIIQFCGGVFVVIVGVMIFFKNPVPQIRKNRAGRSALWQDFASMFGFTLANFVVVIPYILAFFTMFNIDLSLNVEAESAAAHVEQWVNNVLVLGGFLLGAMSWWIALTSIINIFRKGFKPRHMLAINRIAGIVICALGIITLISVIIS